MTAKEYERIARGFYMTKARIKDGPERAGVIAAAEYVAHELSMNDWRFDKERFLKAAGVRT